MPAQYAVSVRLSRCNSGGAALTQPGRRQAERGSTGPQHGAQHQMRLNRELLHVNDSGNCYSSRETALKICINKTDRYQLSLIDPRDGIAL